MDIKTTHEAAKHHAAGMFATVMDRPSAIAAIAEQIERDQPQEVKDARARVRAAVDERRHAVLAKVKRQLTPEFLSTLAEVTRAMGDDIEHFVALDVAEVFRVAGVDAPDLTPIDFWRAP